MPQLLHWHQRDKWFQRQLAYVPFSSLFISTSIKKVKDPELFLTKLSSDSQQKLMKILGKHGQGSIDMVDSCGNDNFRNFLLRERP